MKRPWIKRAVPALVLAIAGIAAGHGAAHASTYHWVSYDYSNYNQVSVKLTGWFYYDGSTVTSPTTDGCVDNWYEPNWGNGRANPYSYFWDNSQHTEVTFYCNYQVQNIYTGQWVTCYPRFDAWYNGTTYSYEGNNNQCT